MWWLAYKLGLIGQPLQKLAVLLSFVLFVFFLLRGRKTRLLYSFLLVNSLIFLYSFSNVLMPFPAAHPQLFFWMVKLYWLTVCFIGLSWLLFCLNFTKHRITVDKVKLRLLFIPPVLGYLFFLTEPLHHLFYQYPNWVYLNLMTDIYGMIGNLYLIKYSFKQPVYTKIQIYLLLTATISPIAFSIYLNIYHGKLNIIFAYFDPVAACYSFALLIFAITAFKYRFLDIVPIALKKIAANMNEAVIVSDKFNNIVYYNRTFSEAFGGYLPKQEDPDINFIIEKIKENSETENTDNHILETVLSNRESKVEGEMVLLKPQQQYYSVISQPIYGKRKLPVGQIISFINVTGYKKLLHEVQEKNKQLAKYAVIATELAIAKERNRMGMEIHDTMGHTLTVLIRMLEVNQLIYDVNPIEAKTKLGQAIQFAREGLTQLRYSVAGHADGISKSSHIINAIEQLIESYQTTGVKIEFSFVGLEIYKNQSDLDPLFNSVIYRICQEALTNSLKHGQATLIKISLRFEGERAYLFICDDGHGSQQIKQGFGLAGMEQRVKKVNGILEYGFDGEMGFFIRAEIPLQGRVESDD